MELELESELELCLAISFLEKLFIDPSNIKVKLLLGKGFFQNFTQSRVQRASIKEKEFEESENRLRLNTLFQIQREVVFRVTFFE